MALAAPNTTQLVSGLEPDILEKAGAAFRALDILNAGVVRLLNAIDIDGTPWVRPQYIAAGGWADSSTVRFSEYKKDWSGTVWLQIGMTGGSLSATAFTLPEPLWPRQRLNFPVNSNNAYGAVAVGTDGQVTPLVGATTNVFGTFSYKAARR